MLKKFHSKLEYNHQLDYTITNLLFFPDWISIDSSLYPSYFFMFFKIYSSLWVQ